MQKRELTEDRHLYIPLADNAVLDLWAGGQGIRARARSTSCQKM